jgi:hypothetical protein
MIKSDYWNLKTNSTTNSEESSFFYQLLNSAEWQVKDPAHTT